MRSVVAIVFLALAVLAGCTGMVAEPAPTLDGTAWQLTAWSEPAINPQDFRITATFADGRMAGKAAVNNYFAAYTEGPEGKFKVTQPGSTMMAGPPAAMRAEKTYLNLLAQVQTHTRTATGLTLADKSGKPLLVFAPAPAKS